MLQSNRAQGGFTLIELLVAMAVVAVVVISLYSLLQAVVIKPVREEGLQDTKHALLLALNNYTINEFALIMKKPKDYQTIALQTLQTEGYLSEGDIKATNAITYDLGIVPGPPMRLRLTMKWRYASRLAFMQPDVQTKTKATWYAIPHYHNLAGTLKTNEVTLARFYDDKKM